MVLQRYNGTYPTTFVESGLQWDAPNAWPPHQYIALQALRALPSNVSSGAIPQPLPGESAFTLVPSGQLGLPESALPGQEVWGGKNASSTGSGADINALSGTFVNGGNATSGEGWRDALREVSRIDISRALCVAGEHVCLTWALPTFLMSPGTVPGTQLAGRFLACSRNCPISS